MDRKWSHNGDQGVREGRPLPHQWSPYTDGVAADLTPCQPLDQWGAVHDSRALKSNHRRAGSITQRIQDGRQGRGERIGERIGDRPGPTEEQTWSSENQRLRSGSKARGQGLESGMATRA